MLSGEGILIVTLAGIWVFAIIFLMTMEGGE